MTARPLVAPSLTVLVDRIQELGVLPHVVFKVLELSSDEGATSKDIESAIIVDPGFSSKVLVLANSAAFGLPREVTSIRDAVSYLGFKNLRNVALTVGAYDLFVGKTDKESLRRRSWWRHSIDTAVCARWLAGKTGKLPSDEAYTCGLLHLIGKTLIDRYGGRDYDAVIELVDLGIPDYVAERDVYGFDHAQVAGAAALKWGLPETLQSGLRYLTLADAGDLAANHRACIALSSWLAQRGAENMAEAPGWALDRLGIHACDTEGLIVESVAAMAATDMRI